MTAHTFRFSYRMLSIILFAIAAIGVQGHRVSGGGGYSGCVDGSTCISYECLQKTVIQGATYGGGGGGHGLYVPIKCYGGDIGTGECPSEWARLESGETSYPHRPMAVNYSSDFLPVSRVLLDTLDQSNRALLVSAEETQKTLDDVIRRAAAIGLASYYSEHFYHHDVPGLNQTEFFQRIAALYAEAPMMAHVEALLETVDKINRDSVPCRPDLWSLFEGIAATVGEYTHIDEVFGTGSMKTILASLGIMTCVTGSVVWTIYAYLFYLNEGNDDDDDEEDFGPSYVPRCSSRPCTLRPIRHTA